MSAIGSIVLALGFFLPLGSSPPSGSLSCSELRPRRAPCRSGGDGLQGAVGVVTIALGALLVYENAAGARLLVS